VLLFANLGKTHNSNKENIMFTSKTWRIVPPLVIIALLITALAPFGAASAQEGIELLPLPDEPIPVDYVFTASFTGELQGTLDRFGEELENLVWYDFYGRKALVGTVIATGETALALETGTQPMAAFEAGVRPMNTTKSLPTAASRVVAITPLSVAHQACSPATLWLQPAPAASIQTSSSRISHKAI